MEIKLVIDLFLKQKGHILKMEIINNYINIKMDKNGKKTKHKKRNSFGRLDLDGIVVCTSSFSLLRGVSVVFRTPRD